MKLCGAGAFACLLLSAAAPGWLEKVSPIITASEKKTYLALPPADRARFEENFWSGKSITAAEYFERLEYIDSTFGSDKPASGANTDPGRVYLSLGAPVRITHIPSSRIFVPVEIWYYDAVPGLLSTELRLIFYRKNSVGFLKLYSPTVDTIRELLLPQAGTVGMFGPNDSVTESDIRQNLKVGPAEDEVITAAAGIASGVKYSGNDEILGRITSPQVMLTGPPRTEVTARLIASHPVLNVLQSISTFGGTQIDLQLEVTAQREVNLEILEGASSVYNNQVHLRFQTPRAIDYTHRLDLLPGDYRAVFTVDGTVFAYPLEVRPRTSMGEIFRAGAEAGPERRQTPFEFEGRQFSLNPDGRFAIVSVPRPGKVTWMIRRGSEVVWRSVSSAQQIAITELPSTGIQPGTYRLEAVTENDSQTADFVLRQQSSEPSPPAPASYFVSFNANLAPARRYAFVAHQWLLRGKFDPARRCLASSLENGATEEARIELARADALAGNLDGARDRVREVLAVSPDNFEALSVFAYIETRLQDYTVAAELYRRALAVQDSPALRMALANLPR